jgi:predicted alpha-1,2-mannosidase
MRALAVAVALVLVAGCGDPTTEDSPILPEVTDPVALVDPTIGTGGLGFAHGSCFVGAAVPHGLVKVGPDTSGPFGPVNFLHYSGYWAGDDKIRGFSHLHLHGAGATDYGVLSVMPVTAFDPAKLRVTDYEARFAKASEHAAAGRYDVTLANGIAVALTATERVAVHRYTGAGALVIDLDKTLSGGSIDGASITLDPTAREITGQLHHLGGMSGGFGGYTVYFVARTTTPWSASHVWAQGTAPSPTLLTAQGTKVGAAIAVPADVQLAVGLSLVSLAGARANLAAEVPTIDLDQVAASARTAWAKLLERVWITGGTEAQRRIFYTSLYHAFLMPSVIGDVDGSYVLAGQPPKVATGWRQMSDLSLWDTYRTVAPLYAWLAPDSARDQARSLIGFGDGLGAYPRWPLAIGETGTMLGASSEIVIADAVLRGVPNAGGELAWPRLRAAAMDPVAPAGGRGGRSDVEAYMANGFVPRSFGRSVSVTTEFAHDDFALAQLAGALGHTADRDALIVRSRGWRTLYDPAVGFLRGKNADGTFPTTSFDALSIESDYAEANAWHSLWMTGSHDAEGLATVMGSREAAVDKLEMFFELAKDDWDNADESAANFPRPYYWHGNEPDINAPFVFGQLGRRDLMDRWVRWVADTHYLDTPEGVAGNDDGGTLGSWYVLATLGVYPVPGSDRWIVGTPRFPQARVVVGGHELVITAEGLSDRNLYVQSVELDGVPIDAAEITHAQLTGATSLQFVMGPAAPAR